MRARVQIHLERLGLAPGAVQREHQLSSQVLTGWIAFEQRAQLADQTSLRSELEVGVDPSLERQEPQFLQTRDLGLCEVLKADFCQRRPAP
jgi:hypothetical protein